MGAELKPRLLGVGWCGCLQSICKNSYDCSSRTEM